ncbi:MarR family winged helix-turn-helix transcriptional regulator [Granulosicoccus sp. 3-233]|uniref:MarR family winged helix-turn-helix transcriptional regulator n=1 Tax=Granulosicoccus sp. 3-233 TaxID=3417969 RepID=UPI003D331F46
MSKQSSEKNDGNSSPLFVPEQFDSEQSIGYLMRLVLNSMKSQIDQAMEPHDLTAMQWQPLYIIANGLATTSAEVARRMQVDTGAVTRMVDRMEQKGLVERVRCQQDRRVVNLQVTGLGRQSASVVPEALCKVLNDHLQGFSAEEADTLKGFLLRMLENGSAAGFASLPARHGGHSTSTPVSTSSSSNKTGKRS